MKRPSIPPALALFLLAPAVGELLSGSSPPLEFFHPFGFLILASLYGSGAVLIRELRARWHLDYRGLLLLGGAYGILEEGLMVKSFFDPNWMDLGILGSFGRWMEVNWVWTEMLTIYHAVFSMSIPIMLIELAYPQRKFNRWISGRWFAAFMLILVAVTGIGFFFLTPYRPPLLQYLLATFAMGILVYTAFKSCRRGTDTNLRKVGNARRLFIVSSAASFAFFLLFYSGPYLIGNPIMIVLLGAIFILCAVLYLNRFGWGLSETAMNRLSVLSGGLAFMVFLAFLQEFNAMTGMSIVGLSAIVAILLLRHKIKQAGITH